MEPPALVLRSSGESMPDAAESDALALPGRATHLIRQYETSGLNTPGQARIHQALNVASRILSPTPCSPPVRKGSSANGFQRTRASSLHLDHNFGRAAHRALITPISDRDRCTR